MNFVAMFSKDFQDFEADLVDQHFEAESWQVALDTALLMANRMSLDLDSVARESD